MIRVRESRSATAAPTDQQTESEHAEKCKRRRLGGGLDGRGRDVSGKNLLKVAVFIPDKPSIRARGAIGIGEVRVLQRVRGESGERSNIGVEFRSGNDTVSVSLRPPRVIEEGRTGNLARRAGE